MNPIELAAARCRWTALPVGEKVLLFGGLLVCAVALDPRRVAPAVVAAVVVAVLVLARVPVPVFAGALAGPLVFLAIGVVPVAVDMVEGLRGGAWTTPASVDRAVTTALRAGAATAATVGLACTTPMAELLGSARRAGLPAPLCHVVDLTYRMIGVLLHTTVALRESMVLRLGPRGRAGTVAALGGQFGTVFAHAILRSRRMSEAISLRAEPGSVAVVDRGRPVSVTRTTAVVAVLAAVVALGVLA